MRLKVIDYSKKAKPFRFDGIVYGRHRNSNRFGWSAWYVFNSVRNAIKSAMCGAVAGEDWELVTVKPKGNVCKKCNRFQMETK